MVRVTSTKRRSKTASVKISNKNTLKRKKKIASKHDGGKKTVIALQPSCRPGKSSVKRRKSGLKASTTLVDISDDNDDDDDDEHETSGVIGCEENIGMTTTTTTTTTTTCVNEDDIAFVDEYEPYLQAFSQANIVSDNVPDRYGSPNTIEHTKDRDMIVDADTMMADVESRPRTATWHKHELTENVRLPVKSLTGANMVENIHMQPRCLSSQHIESENSDTVSSTATSETQHIIDQCKNEGPIVPESLSKPQREQAELLHFTHTRTLIASLASGIVADPEQNIGSLRQLHSLCDDVNHRIRCLALMSCMEVFKDVCPGYRIRANLDTNVQHNTERLSKQVKKLQLFEITLLRAYRDFVTRLTTLTRRVLHPSSRNRQSSAQYVLASTGSRCLCELLVTLPHFNFISHIVRGIIPLLNHSFDESLSTMACNAVRRVFVLRSCPEDLRFELVKGIAKTVHAHKFRIRPAMLQCFIHLPLNKRVLEQYNTHSDTQRDGVTKSKSKRITLKKRVRMSCKHDAGVERELDAARVQEVSVRKRKRTQLEILKLVFGVYFGVLKGATRNHTLLSVVLEGLAKFAQLVNVELVLDLLACLRSLMSSSSSSSSSSHTMHLPLSSQLHCVLAAFETLNGHGDAVSIDCREFYQNVYSLLPSIALPENHCLLPLLLQCLEHMFLLRRHRRRCSRQVSFERVASFIKRCVSLVLLLPTNALASSLSVAIHTLLEQYPLARALLDNESMNATSSFRHDIDDADHANGRASKLWELTLQARSYHPTVSSLCKAIAEGNALSEVSHYDARLSPLELLTSLSANSVSGENACWNPSVVSPVPISKSKKRKNITQRLNASDMLQAHTSTASLFDDDTMCDSALDTHFARCHRRARLIYRVRELRRQTSTLNARHH